MKLKNLVAAVVFASAVMAAPVMAADYVIDKEGQHAFVNFKVSHLGYSYIIGRFNDFSGTFSHDPKKPGASKTSVTIKTQSIDTNHAERDKHLRSEDFFEVAKYPTITFESTAYEAGSSADRLMGNLTIRGITRPVTIDVKQVGEGKDPWGGYRSGFIGKVTLNAADYGLPDWVGDVEVELNIEGVLQGES